MISERRNISDLIRYKVREFGLGDEAVAAATQGDMVSLENVF